jgi:hypothetical protein
VHQCNNTTIMNRQTSQYSKSTYNSDQLRYQCCELLLASCDPRTTTTIGRAATGFFGELKVRVRTVIQCDAGTVVCSLTFILAMQSLRSYINIYVD